MNGYDSQKLSEEWNFQVFSKYYGYTENIYYKDFVVDLIKISSDINIDDDEIKLERTSSLNINDKILIYSPNKNSSEENVVESIINSNNIKLKNKIQDKYFYEDGIYIKVLRNSFPNNHIHGIKGGEIQTLSIDSHKKLDYPLRHSHHTRSLIEQVSSLEDLGEKMIVGGNSTIIYNTTNKGNSFDNLVDLKYNNDDTKSVGNITCSEKYNDLILVGTDNGFLYSNTTKNGNILPIK